MAHFCAVVGWVVTIPVAQPAGIGDRLDLCTGYAKRRYPAETVLKRLRRFVFSSFGAGRPLIWNSVGISIAHPDFGLMAWMPHWRQTPEGSL